MVKTTALVIVVSGLNVRDEDSDVSDGVGVIDDSSEDVEESSERDELLSRELVEVEVEEDIVDEDSEVEEDCVEDSSVVLGGSLVEEEGGSLSTKISKEISSDGWFVRGAWWFREGTREFAHPVAAGQT